MEKNALIYVAGHTGLIGTSLVGVLRRRGYRRLLTAPREELDLTRQAAVERYFRRHRPDYVFLLAARVGGIWANSAFPAEFLHQNLLIEANVIHAAWKSGVKKLLFLGSSCTYPKHCPQPIREEALLTGAVEPTNEPYAVAKIAGIKLCQAYRRQYGCRFIVAVPANTYGPGDDFGEGGHVVASLVRRMDEAREKKLPSVPVWGTGKPRREFLYVGDVADACLFLMRSYEGEALINVGGGRDTSIAALARLVRKTVGYRGRLAFDVSRPDGMPRRLLDARRLRRLGWRPRIPLARGLRLTWEWYRDRARSGEGV